MEFPHWAPLTAVNVLLFICVVLPTKLLMNLSNQEQGQVQALAGPLWIPFDWCLYRRTDYICIGQCVISPSAFRYCLCVNLTVLLLQAPRIFFTVYPIIIVTCLSLSQLCMLIVKGILSNGYKQTVICLVVISILVSVHLDTCICCW